MKSICFVSNKYPNDMDPNGLVFVQQLVWTMADIGIQCSVICPLAVNLYPSLVKVPYYVEETTEKGNKVEVYFPKYFGLGQSHYIFGKSPAPLTTALFTKAVKKVISSYKLLPDAIYGHFITPAGIAAARIGRELNIPAFLAHGESTQWSIDQFGAHNVAKELENIDGVIAVSTRNKDLLIAKKCVTKDKIKVFPNGYRSERFYQMDKMRARKKMGFPQEDFIVGFVGSFDDRKGVLRLQEAVGMVKGVKYACAGKGKLMPGGPDCLLAKPVENALLPFFYSAIDVFALPTLNEGCCNAIIEALACGCPVISSNLSFNDDILDENCSVRIDPGNVNDLASAIEALHADPDKLMQMGKAALEKASKLTLDTRAENILDFMENMSCKRSSL